MRKFYCWFWKMVFSAVLLLSQSQHASGATHTWSGAGGNKLFSNPANWVAGSVPANSTNWVELRFPPTGTADAIMDVQNLAVNSITIQRTNFSLLGTNGWPLTLGDAVSAGSVDTFGGTSVFSATLRLAFAHGVSFNSTGQLQLLGWLQGPGYVVKHGPADVVIGGPTDNTHTNYTIIYGGNLWLAKPSGVIAVPGELQKIGGQVILTNSHQIKSNALVQLNNADFIGGAYQQILNNVEALNVVKVNSGTGGNITLGDLRCYSLFSELYLEGFGGTVTLAGTFSMGRATETFLFGTIGLAVPAPGKRGATFFLDDTGTSGSEPLVHVAAVISGPTNAPIRYTGNGIVELLSGISTYQGATFVESNVSLTADLPEGFGSPVGGTYVSEYGRISLDFSTATTWSEPLHFTGTTNYPQSMLYSSYDALTLSGVIRVTNQVGISVSSTNGLIISGAVGGPGTITKFGGFSGEWPLIFNGSINNTFTGGLAVADGVVELRRVNGALTVPGPLVIGAGCTVRTYFNNQLGDTAPVRIYQQGFLRLMDVSDTIGSLELTEGNVLTGTGTLTVNSNITTHADDVESFISGNLALGANGITINVENGGSPPDLLVPAIVSGSAFASITKTGPGQLDFTGANTFFGNVFVNEGTLKVRNALALGSTTGGTIVSTNGILEFNTVSAIHGESLSLIGGTFRLTQPVTNSWGGSVSLGGNATIETLYSNSRLILTNIISGAGGFAKTGIGILDLTGVSANTYAGRTVVAGGVLNLNKTNGPAIPGDTLDIGFSVPANNAIAGSVESLRAAQVGDGTAVSLSSLGTWDLNGLNDTIGSLAGSGTVALGVAQLTHGGLGTDTSFGGQITGNGSISLVKVGFGTFTMTGVQPYTGRTAVNGGTLVVNGTNGPGLTTVAGGTLAGRGQVGNVTASGGVISPGTSTGILKTGNLIWGPSVTYRCELNNTNAGTGYDQLSVTGTVNVSAAQLQLVLGTPGAISNRYTILVNDGTDAITSVFSGLTEGATFYASGTPFRITYVGGTGNDIVLTQLGLQQKPQIGSVKKLPNGNIEVNGTGISNLLYSVYASTNIAAPAANWLDLGLIQATPTGALQFVDTDAALYPQRFYQFVLPPYNQ